MRGMVCHPLAVETVPRLCCSSLLSHASLRSAMKPLITKRISAEEEPDARLVFSHVLLCNMRTGFYRPVSAAYTYN